MARRLLYGLITGLTTFALGLGLASSWNAHRPMSLCELDANPEAYAGKTIRFRAMLFKGTSKYIMAISTCRNGERPIVSIERNPAEAANVLLPESPISPDDKGFKLYLMDAEVVGQLDSPIGRSCFGPKYHVTNARVEQVFSVNQFNGVQEAAQWMKSNSY